MAISAWSFFQNGGQKLYVLSPTEDSVIAYTKALETSLALNVDLVAIPALLQPSIREIVMGPLIAHAELSPNRFALIDPPSNLSSNELINFAKKYQTINAALYAPWPISNSTEALIAPSAAIAGVISRVDRERGVFKNPAGSQAQLKGIARLETSYSQSENDSLNLAGVNVIRVLNSSSSPLPMGARVLQSSHISQSPYIAVNRFIKLLKYSILKSIDHEELQVSGQGHERVYKVLIENYLQDNYLKGAFAGARP